MDYKYILKIFIFVFIFISLILFTNIIGFKLNYNVPKKLLQVITMENFNNNETNIILPSAKGDAFCETHRGYSGTLDNSCNNLTKKNCNSTSCCVWTNDNKCVAGGIQGPTFNSDINGKTKKLDYYFFQNKCYGEKCNKY